MWIIWGIVALFRLGACKESYSYLRSSWPANGRFYTSCWGLWRSSSSVLGKVREYCMTIPESWVRDRKGYLSYKLLVIMGLVNWYYECVLRECRRRLISLIVSLKPPHSRSEARVRRVSDLTIKLCTRGHGGVAQLFRVRRVERTVRTGIIGPCNSRFPSYFAVAHSWRKQVWRESKCDARLFFFSPKKTLM